MDDVHCKDTIPKIRYKYSQKRNCAAIWIAHKNMNVEIGTEGAQFLFCEYVNQNFFAAYTYRNVDKKWRSVDEMKPHVDE